MVDQAYQPGDADSSRACGFFSGFHGLMHLNHDTLLTVPKWSVDDFF